MEYRLTLMPQFYCDIIKDDRKGVKNEKYIQRNYKHEYNPEGDSCLALQNNGGEHI
jgi:hypothetical protein